MFIEREKLTVRKLETRDKYVLAKWLSDPQVLEYYEGRDNPFSIEKVEEKFFSLPDHEVRCIIEFDGVGIGYVQYYPLNDEYRKLYGYDGESDTIYGMDQFIGEVDYWNKGIGTKLVNLMVEYLVDEQGADKVVMEPQTWNERAIHCYEKCGFKKIKLLPENELHEGSFRDCWLIEFESSGIKNKLPSR